MTTTASYSGERAGTAVADLDAAEVLGTKGWAAIGSFDAEERSRVLDVLGSRPSSSSRRSPPPSSSVVVRSISTCSTTALMR